MAGNVTGRNGKKVEPVGNDCAMTDMDVRIFLRDTDPDANLLLDDFEFTPKEIRTAMNITVDRWNDTPPEIYRMDDDEFPYRSILLLGVASNLLSMAAHRYRRNSLAINAGGTSVNDQDKAGQYDQAAARLRDEYLHMIRTKKRELNANLGWGWA
ncbi:MAG: hypothetical protein IJG84_11870 [Kiritimatiellae bacterium]|nr:hypothetical protein [Kiritimatiellia bacterium]